MSSLQQRNGFTQPPSSLHLDILPSQARHGTLRNKTSSKNGLNISGNMIQRADDLNTPTSLSGSKRRLEQEHDIKRKQQQQQQQEQQQQQQQQQPMARSIMTCTLTPLNSPPLPQVVRRSSYLNLAKNVPSTTPPPLKQTYHLPQTRHGPTGAQTTAHHPRWHSQSCMLFLALRNHPEHAMPRTDLINTALVLDNTISTERGFPLAFRGKTPKNSASALLTNNNGRHFQSYRPSGSRSMHFRLTFEPANFCKAVAIYDKWMKILVTHDWPLCFGKPCLDSSSSLPLLRLPLPSPPPPPPPETPLTPYPTLINISSDQQKPHLTEFDEFLAFRKTERLRMRLLNQQEDNDKENQDTTTTTTVKTTTKIQYTSDQDDNQGICESIQWRIQGDEDYHPAAPLPTTYQDIVYTKTNHTKIPSSVHAQRRLPVNTPLGFYFGVPTTEDEFELFKEDQGNATKYCLMYDRTVLDATDDRGQLFTDPKGKMYCPFHFMRQATSPDLANILLLKGKIYNQVICWTKRSIDQDEELLVWIECEK
ncbi:hypothetical protein BC941DRAFT_431527 [Chlamydoabsidia padenii]|nr:hypothetical protein BC941DRAFT_431527 [Chlamydoabsidia padenii]